MVPDLLVEAPSDETRALILEFCRQEWRYKHGLDLNLLKDIYLYLRYAYVCMYGMVWYGMLWYVMACYVMVWYVMVWYGVVCMLWYGMVCCGMYVM